MRRSLLAIAVVLSSGCADAVPTSTSPSIDDLVGSPLPRRTTYPDASGEPYPTSSTALASITFRQSKFIYPNCDLADNGCNITFEIQHRGIWNGTEQIITVANDGATAPSVTYGGDSQCLEWENLPETKCVLKRVYRVLYYDIPCGQRISGNVVHKAWWLGFWGGGVGGGNASLNIPGFRIGEVQAISYPSSFNAPACAEEGGGGSGGGGGGGSNDCIHYYAIWYDPDTGEIERSQYLYTVCGGYAQ